MVVFTLAVCMVSLFIISFFTNNQEIISPAVAFTAPFSLATINLIYNINKWKVELHWNTFWVIIGGTIVFLITISFYRLFIRIIGQMRRERFQYNVTNKETDLRLINIPKFNYYIFILLQAITFLLCLRAVMSISRHYGITGNISELIAGYKNLKSFTTEDVSLGKINNLLYDFCYASGYVWFYILANNYAANKKIEKLALINLLLSIAIALEKGSRGGAVALICSGAAMVVLFWQKDSHQGRLSFKQLMGIVVGASLVVGSFQMVGELLGRVSSADFEGYLAVYLSAPIRNLDYFLNNTQHTLPSIFGKMTFVRMINYLGGKLNISSWIYELDLPSLYANGFVTGNVYTTFYAYVYDFGYIGVGIMMFLMGLISQFFYRKANIYKCKKYNINLWMVLYAYIFYSIAFSFFSNKFYETLVAIQFIKYILYWFIIRYFLEKMRFKFGSRKLY